MNPFEQSDPRWALWNAMNGGASAPSPVPALGAMQAASATLAGAMANPGAQPPPIAGAPSAVGAVGALAPKPDLTDYSGAAYGVPADASKATTFQDGGAMNRIGKSLVSGHAAQDWADYSGNHGLSAVGALASIPDAAVNYAKFQNNVMSGAYQDEAGNTDMRRMTQNGVPASMGVVGLLGGGGLARTAIRGAEGAGEVGIFGGAGAMARSPAEKGILSASEKALADGSDPEAVRKLGGWFRGVDGGMRKEISDQGARLSNDAYQPGLNGKLVDYFDHPELYQRYPSARDIGFTTDPSHHGILPTVEGAFLPGHQGNPNGSIFLNIERATSEDAAKNTILHEIQHHVQEREGFNPGANPDAVGAMVAGPRVVSDARQLSLIRDQLGLNAADAQSMFAQVQGRKPYNGAVGIAATKTPEQIADAPKDAFDAYSRNMGEVEARNVEARSNFTDQQRRDISPMVSTGMGGSMPISAKRQLRFTGDEPKGTVAMASGVPVGALAQTYTPDAKNYRKISEDELTSLQAKMDSGQKLTNADRNAVRAYAIQNGMTIPSKNTAMQPETNPTGALAAAMKDPSSLPAPVGRVGQASDAELQAARQRAVTGQQRPGDDVLMDQVRTRGAAFAQPVSAGALAAKPQAAPAVAPDRQPPKGALQGDAAELAAIQRGDTAAVLKMQTAQNAPSANTTGRPPLTVTGAPPQAGSDAEMFRGLEGKYGLPQDYLGKIGAIESGNGRNMSTPLSSAKGYFQFTDGTAKQYGVDVTSTASGADGAARLAVANRNSLAKGLGVSPDQITGAQLYLAHQQGAAGALKILRNPDASMESLVGEKAAKANGGAGLTGGQFAAKWGGKFDRATMGKAPMGDAPMVQGPGSGGARGALAPAVTPPARQLDGRPGVPEADGEDAPSSKAGALGALMAGGGRGRSNPVQFGPAEKDHEADLSLASLIKRRGKVVKGVMSYGRA